MQVRGDAPLLASVSCQTTTPAGSPSSPARQRGGPAELSSPLPRPLATVAHSWLPSRLLARFLGIGPRREELSDRCSAQNDAVVEIEFPSESRNALGLGPETGAAPRRVSPQHRVPRRPSGRGGRARLRAARTLQTCDRLHRESLTPSDLARDRIERLAAQHRCVESDAPVPRGHGHSPVHRRLSAALRIPREVVLEELPAQVIANCPSAEDAQHLGEPVVTILGEWRGTALSTAASTSHRWPGSSISRPVDGSSNG